MASPGIIGDAVNALAMLIQAGSREYAYLSREMREAVDAAHTAHRALVDAECPASVLERVRGRDTRELKYGDADELQFDDDALWSDAREDGFWVQGWVWFSSEDLES